MNNNRDLFGEVVVTDDDIFAWVMSVAPRWTYSKRAYENYVRSWNVAEKVRVAKMTGRFDDVVSVLDNRRPWYDEKKAVD